MFVMHEIEVGQRAAQIRFLTRAAASLAVVIGLLAGFLIWRSRDTLSRLPDRGKNNISSTGNGNRPVNVQPPLGPSTTRTPTGNKDEPALADVVEDFELTERSGRKVTNKELLGRPWAVCFVFTNCAGPCPLVTGKMKLLQDRFAGTPLRLVTITVDPKRDTPQRLTQYAEAFGADEEQWLFLTGEQNEIYHLIGHSFGLTVREEIGKSRKKGWEITHSTRVVHVDAAGHIQGKYDAKDDVEMAALARALEKELRELPINSGEESQPVDAPVPPLRDQAVATPPASNAKGR